MTVRRSAVVVSGEARNGGGAAGEEKKKIKKTASTHSPETARTASRRAQCPSPWSRARCSARRSCGRWWAARARRARGLLVRPAQTLSVGFVLSCVFVCVCVRVWRRSGWRTMLRVRVRVVQIASGRAWTVHIRSCGCGRRKFRRGAFRCMPVGQNQKRRSALQSSAEAWFNGSRSVDSLEWTGPLLGLRDPQRIS